MDGRCTTYTGHGAALRSIRTVRLRMTCAPTVSRWRRRTTIPLAEDRRASSASPPATVRARTVAVLAEMPTAAATRFARRRIPAAVASASGSSASSGSVIGTVTTWTRRNRTLPVIDAPAETPKRPDGPAVVGVALHAEQDQPGRPRCSRALAFRSPEARIRPSPRHRAHRRVVTSQFPPTTARAVRHRTHDTTNRRYSGITMAAVAVKPRLIWFRRPRPEIVTAS